MHLRDFVRWRIRGVSRALLVAGLAQRAAEPLETLVETVTGGGAG